LYACALYRPRVKCPALDAYPFRPYYGQVYRLVYIYVKFFFLADLPADDLLYAVIILSLFCYCINKKDIYARLKLSPS